MLLVRCDFGEYVSFFHFKLMSSLSIEGIKILSLRFSFLGQSTILSNGSLELGISLDLFNLSSLLSFSHSCLRLRSSFVDDFDNLGLDLRGNHVFLSLYLSDEHCTDLLGLYNRDFHGG